MSKGTLSEDCKLDFDENNDLEKTVMHGFRTNNALYTISLSFTKFAFLLTRDCFYFKLNLGVAYKSVAYKGSI